MSRAGSHIMRSMQSLQGLKNTDPGDLSTSSVKREYIRDHLELVLILDLILRRTSN
jgi:hypothetical protein